MRTVLAEISNTLHRNENVIFFTFLSARNNAGALQQAMLELVYTLHVHMEQVGTYMEHMVVFY